MGDPVKKSIVMIIAATILAACSHSGIVSGSVVPESTIDTVMEPEYEL